MLYKYRDEHEACDFLNNLMAYLKPKPGTRVLDLACGRGRHARYLCKHDLNVTGIDLSPNNVKFAQGQPLDNLRFIQGDMCDDLGSGEYSHVFNLFTSFGYFESQEQSLRAMKNIARSLQEGGTLVLDFMNTEKVRLGLVREEEVTQKAVNFKVRRFIREGFIIKEIHVDDGEQQQHFEERVQMLDLPSFEAMFTETGLELVDCFGDFTLKPFSPTDSERLIMIAKKP